MQTHRVRGARAETHAGTAQTKSPGHLRATRAFGNSGYCDSLRSWTSANARVVRALRRGWPRGVRDRWSRRPMPAAAATEAGRCGHFRAHASLPPWPGPAVAKCELWCAARTSFGRFGWLRLQTPSIVSIEGAHRMPASCGLSSGIGTTPGPGRVPGLGPQAPPLHARMSYPDPHCARPRRAHPPDP